MARPPPRLGFVRALSAVLAAFVVGSAGAARARLRPQHTPGRRTLLGQDGDDAGLSATVPRDALPSSSGGVPSGGTQEAGRGSERFAGTGSAGGSIAEAVDRSVGSGGVDGPGGSASPPAIAPCSESSIGAAEASGRTTASAASGRCGEGSSPSAPEVAGTRADTSVSDVGASGRSSRLGESTSGSDMDAQSSKEGDGSSDSGDSAIEEDPDVEVGADGSDDDEVGSSLSGEVVGSGYVSSSGAGYSTDDDSEAMSVYTANTDGESIFLVSDRSSDAEASEVFTDAEGFTSQMDMDDADASESEAEDSGVDGEVPGSDDESAASSSMNSEELRIMGAITSMLSGPEPDSREPQDDDGDRHSRGEPEDGDGDRRSRGEPQDDSHDRRRIRGRRRAIDAEDTDEQDSDAESIEMNWGASLHIHRPPWERWALASDDDSEGMPSDDSDDLNDIDLAKMTWAQALLKLTQGCNDHASEELLGQARACGHLVACMRPYTEMYPDPKEAETDVIEAYWDYVYDPVVERLSLGDQELVDCVSETWRTCLQIQKVCLGDDEEHGVL